MPTLTLEIPDTLLHKITRSATLRGETVTEFIIGFLDRHIPDTPIEDEYKAPDATDFPFTEGYSPKNNISQQLRGDS